MNSTVNKKCSINLGQFVYVAHNFVGTVTEIFYHDDVDKYSITVQKENSDVDFITVWEKDLKY